jgi:hypothetical protein
MSGAQHRRSRLTGSHNNPAKRKTVGFLAIPDGQKGSDLAAKTINHKRRLSNAICLSYQIGLPGLQTLLTVDEFRHYCAARANLRLLSGLCCFSA